MTAPVDIRVIVDGLAARAADLARELFPVGVREGPEYRIGSPAGEKGRSMAVRLTGPRAGVWSDFAAGTGGDALDLVAAALFSGDKKSAVQWAKRWLGIDDRGAQPKITRPAPPARPADQDDDACQRRTAAWRIFMAAREHLAGTPADLYLRGRGIKLDQLGRQPRSLRFHSCLSEPETGRQFASLVAGICAPEGRFLAVHRTFLEQRPDGSWAKSAAMKDPKKTLGTYRGGFIRIWRGASGRPIKTAIEGSRVIVTEGIEDALTVALAVPADRVVCAVSLANLAAIRFPPAITELIIHAHNDENESAQRALRSAIAAHQQQGKKVRIARAPAGIKDFNDVLMLTGVA